MKEVRRTSHISFSEEDKTFRLYTGSSIYAFCLTPELLLEHLHWGEAVPDNYDLRYLSQSSRSSHFNTVEAAPDPFGGKIVLAAETLEEIQRTWRENKVWAPSDLSEHELFHKRRLENFSWRVMTKVMRRGLLRNDYNVSQRKPTASLSSGSESPKQKFLGPPMPKASIGPSMLRRSHSQPVIDISGVSLDVEESPAKPMKHGLSGEDKVRAAICGALKDAQPHIDVRNKAETFERKIGKIGKGGICHEYSDHGTGDFRTPSFIVVDNFTGSSISPLRYRRHKIYRGKLPIGDGLPSIRCMSDDEASTLVVTMADSITGLEVDIVFVSLHDYDVITRRVVLRNVDRRETCSQALFSGSRGEYQCGSSKVILKACSFTIDFEAEPEPFYLVQLCGNWARERNVVETKLTQGVMSFGSTRGVSSHQHNPFAAISFGPPNESHGEVRGFALVYSGNFLLEADRGEFGRMRVNMGIHPMSTSWHLPQGASFYTPEAVLVRSNQGLGGMSRIMHRLILDRLIPHNWADEHPPILLNTWEAKYFHINHDNVVEMAKVTAKVGIDLLVIDDGWFGKRQDENSSLGDWIVDLTKFPQGLKGVAEEVNALGLKLGLWFEPEMVSEQSALFSAHPDWYLHVPGRPRQLGRNQMVLDLSMKIVRDYLFNSISTVLSSANIEYMKWDMNRPLTEVYSATTGHNEEVWQAEISHRYVLGVYELQDRIVTAFPHILFENCASGGGRFDLGMLYYSSQIWCSDNTDALVRMRIQYGTSLAYPARCVGAHVGPVPNHLTGNIARLRTRGFVAMSGTFGYELDITTSSSADRLTFQKQCEFYRYIAPIVRWGDLYRLWDPFKRSLAAWMYVTRDKTQAVVFAFSLNSDHWSELVPRLPLQGLIEDAEYFVTEPMPNNLTQSSGTLMIIETPVPVCQLGRRTVTLNGKLLMTAGLPVRFYAYDDSVVFILTKNDSCSICCGDTVQRLSCAFSRWKRHM